MEQWFGRAWMCLLVCIPLLLAALPPATGAGEVGSPGENHIPCSLRILVLRVPEVPDPGSYWTVQGAGEINEATRWYLDLYGMEYDEIEAADLSADLLHEEGCLAYSVVVDNGNRLQLIGNDALLLDAWRGTAWDW